MNEQNLIKAGDRTPSERREAARKAGQASGASRRRNAALKKLFKQVAALDAPDRVRAEMSLMGIPEDEQTVLMAIAVSTGKLAALGDKDARRDFIRMIGEDPDLELKREELKLKQAEAERKHPQSGGPTVFEQMMRELYERSDGEAEEVHE